ncbi:FIST signal transduction protein [Pseudanabaena sp. 'Roaring Creek']|uniref:FIST signal transduction protein n=1 Tax=Pseudanabaena sp. 'Roaring Creek' TaxID=1681830 RepID=UPI0006D82EBE|nr:FIST N-terminal domain-containing protein [Pseudanabaena sp. 'Roaring Creek']
MKIEQYRLTVNQGWEPSSPNSNQLAHLVLVFGGTDILKAENYPQYLKQIYPNATIIGCSTAGEIFDTRVADDTIVVTAIEFEHTQIKGNYLPITKTSDSFAIGAKLAQSFPTEDLAHLFVLSDGLIVNGSDLISGLRSQLPEHVTVTGGLAGDGSRFAETLILWNELLEKEIVAAIGIYGDRIKIGYGSLGGWATFGAKRVVTKSQGNILYELDGLSALELYKKYLGDHAVGLPASGLLFPLSLYNAEGDRSVVRTILAIDEAEQSLTFAGDVPEGSVVQLMQTNFERLIDGAIGAAQTSISYRAEGSPDLAILISCVGRKLVLKQRIEEEVDGVREVMGQSTVLTGFYSYGEMAPASMGERCELHNQTMTITTLSEQ